MKRFWFITLLLPLLAACSNNVAEEGATPPLNGPSMVMFYTDN